MIWKAVWRSRIGPDRGIAAIILLFAMSAFSVLSIGALTTALGSAPAGRNFAIFRSIPQDALIKFIAPMVVPNDWRTQGATGSFQFQLPVLVPETGNQDSGSSAAWHAMSEIPGVAVCCEARAGVCAGRNESSGGARILDWTPGVNDALWLSFDLATGPGASDAAEGRTVTATVSTSGAVPSPGATAVSCQLEFDGAVIAKGTAHLRQGPADGGTASEVVAGTMRLAVKTQ